MRSHDGRRAGIGWLASLVLAGVAACGGGGGTGNERDSGVQKTTLRVEATDGDGDALSYQWRATAGSIENRNASETVWTLPAGPGLHFAYVTVSDGKGGYAEQQYAVSSDALKIEAPVRAEVKRVVPPFTGADSGGSRLRFLLSGRQFVPEGGGTRVERLVYLPSVRVELRDGSPVPAFTGISDEAGEVLLPPLINGGAGFTVWCSASSNAVLVECANFTQQTPGARPQVIDLQPFLPAGHNLRLYGHAALADGGVCGTRDEFAGLFSTGTVQLIDANGTALTPAVQINRFGDYAIDAPVLVNATLSLRVRCESLTKDIRIPSDGGFIAATARELSEPLPNVRPRVVKVVANGPEGNVRGRMVVSEVGVSSNGLPGSDRFLAFKGKDTRMGACEYYTSFGAAAGCDAQGNMIDPISFDDWKRQNQLAPYLGSNTEVRATYINKMDLNLVRRMTATKVGPSDRPDSIAFYVCNNPGPEGTSQREIDEVIRIALAGEREVACVAMEWSVTRGVNGNRPFTKFLTFGPDGRLLLSVNLDGRGEKFMPGTCVACHGGANYAGKFPDARGGRPSPFLGSAFLTFDTANYFLAEAPGLRKSDQQAAFKALNELVVLTERDDPDFNNPRGSAGAAGNAIQNLFNGWYSGNGTTLNEAYVPEKWLDIELGRNGAVRRPGAARLYQEVVSSSCRTCHAAFKGFDWDFYPDRIVVQRNNGRRNEHVCGGSEDLTKNASMPNALISRDRALEKVRSDPTLAALMQEFFGCVEPLPDPAYARR